MRCLNFGVKNSLVIPSNLGALFLSSLVNAYCTYAFVNGFIISFSRDYFLLVWLILKNEVTFFFILWNKVENLLGEVFT